MQENKHADRLHAKHSPSSLKHKKLCPKWENESKDTVFTDDGTKCHEAVETGDLSKLTELQHYYANCAIKYVQPLIDAASKVVKEERLWNSSGWMSELTHGSPDLMCWAGESHMDIVDYKFGRLPVDHRLICARSPLDHRVIGWSGVGVGVGAAPVAASSVWARSKSSGTPMSMKRPAKGKARGGCNPM